jgi:hypothetical protein
MHTSLRHLAEGYIAVATKPPGSRESNASSSSAGQISREQRALT